MKPFMDYLSYHKRCYNPYPIVIPRSMYIELTELGEAIIQGVKAVAGHYLDDPRMQSRMPLTGQFKEILSFSYPQPYHIGMLRPDLIFSRDHGPLVCEINARFPINGMALSQWLGQTIATVPYLADAGIEPPQSLNRLLPAMLNRFDIDKPLALINKKEAGSESRFFLDQFRAAGGRAIIAAPEELQLKRGGIELNGESVNQFILELDRAELLNFKTEVLEQMAGYSNYFNDLRTLILAHDKRMLGVLRDRDIMSSYLEEPYLTLLNHFISKSVNLDNDVAFDEALKNPGQWVIKKISGGRGVGMLIGPETSEDTWASTLTNNRDEYMAQEYIPYKELPVVHENNGNPACAMMYLVGTLPCFDDKVFGPGMFRTSKTFKINLGQGEGDAVLLGPAIQKAEAEDNRRAIPVYHGVV